MGDVPKIPSTFLENRKGKDLLSLLHSLGHLLLPSLSKTTSTQLGHPAFESCLASCPNICLTSLLHAFAHKHWSSRSKLSYKTMTMLCTLTLAFEKQTKLQNNDFFCSLTTQEATLTRFSLPSSTIRHAGLSFWDSPLMQARLIGPV